MIKLPVDLDNRIASAVEFFGLHEQVRLQGKMPLEYKIKAIEAL